MKIRNLSVLLFLILTECLSAQNALLLMKPGDSIPGVVVKTKRNGYYQEYEYRIPAVPDSVSSAIPLKVDYRKGANYALNHFQRAHLLVHRMDIRDAFLNCTNTGFGGAVKPSEDEQDDDVKEQMKKVLFPNKALQEMIYNWMMPVYQKAFSIMSTPEQEDYLSVFQRGLVFIDTFNLKQQSQAAESPDYAYEVGSLNAFVFRRVNNNELSLADCRMWIERIIKDLSTVKRKDSRKTDDVVLYREKTNGYCEGHNYRYRAYDGETVIVRRTRDGYELVPGGVFADCWWCGPDLIIGYDIDSLTPETFRRNYRLIHYDSSGSFVTQLPGYVPSSDVVYKGKGKSARLLLFGMVESRTDYTPSGEEIYTEYGMCYLVDLDSGMILMDSMLIPAEGVDDWNWEVTYPTVHNNYMVFRHSPTGLFGMIDRNGNIVLPPKYTSIEATEKPKVFKVNGKKKLKVH